MNRLNLLGALSFLFLVSAHARPDDPIVCITKDNSIAPVQKEMPDPKNNSPEWIAFKNQWGPSTSAALSYTCCPGLKLNLATRVCEDSTIQDPTFATNCTDDRDCRDGKGCFDINEDHLFTTDSDDPVKMLAMQRSEERFDAQMSTLTQDPKTIGATCTRDMECASYKCELQASTSPSAGRPTSARCVQNKSCRLAEKDERALGNVQCADPYEKVNGVCKEKIITHFMGSIDGLKIRPVSGQQCQFELDPVNAQMTPENVRDAASLAVMSTRAMEWLFATSTVEDRKDCLFTARWMRDHMKALMEKRKAIVRDFSKKFELLEEDFKKISTAKKDDMTVITSPCTVPETSVYEQTTAHDVNLRRATGLDYLCYIQKRNDLFIDYETKMKAHVAAMAKLADGYTASWDWSENAKSWKLGKGDPAVYERDYDDQACRSWPLWHHKIKRRWGQKYVVNGNAEDNKRILEKDTPDFKVGKVIHRYIDVKDYLSAVEHNLDKEAAIGPYRKRKYYLIDPLMPGGSGQNVKFENFGAGDGYERYLGNASWWTGIPGFLPVNPILGIINSVQARNNSTGLLGIHARFRPNIISYLKSLKGDSTQKNFIFEPELPASFENRVCLLKADSPECIKTMELQARGGCIDNLEDPACKFFKQYVDNFQDVALAQMLAYSRHDKKKYIDFFKNESSGRRKLFTRFELDFNNLKHYYTGLAELRKKENLCLATAVGQIRSPEFNGKGMGLLQGSKNYYVTGKELKGSKSVRNETPAKVADKRINPIKIGINTDSMSSTNKAIPDSLKDTSDALGADINGGTGAMAAASRYMSSVNKKARDSGLDVVSREKAFLASISGTGGGPSASAGPKSSSSGFGSSAESNAKAVLDEDLKSVSEPEQVSPAAPTGSVVPAYPAAASSGSGYQTTSEPLSNDSSGMSDEEKETMAANYDRTKRDYKTSEEDSLFQVLSKTYVRNLDKILIRKKRLEEGNSQ